MSDTVSLLIGTTKGAFILSAGGDRTGWTTSGPHCDGWSINHVIGDPETGTIWAGGGGDWTGAGVWCSDNGGESWTLVRLSRGEMDNWAASDPEFAAMINWTDAPLPFDDAFTQIWSLGYGHGGLYAGTKPARLLCSRNGGRDWSEVESLRAQEPDEGWSPGAAGLVLHTIVTHPEASERAWVGISAAGVFATEDAGATWERRNRLANAAACPEHDHPAAPRDGETGHCVHNIVRAPSQSDRLYQQNHHGVWRSHDGGRSWEDINDGLPSTFGFPICVHPRDPDIIWVLPLNGDSTGRYPPDAQAAIWKSRDGGTTWQDRRAGLPQENCFFTVLRQAMATDRGDPAGLYFGTNSGSIFASLDEGETFTEIARHLPTVLSVETLH